jgi:DNA polymerase-4/DNA polymerase IV (DinB-like DNA polymerase)
MHQNQNTTKQYKIVHIDMDAFFAAVEVRDKPELAGKPLIIGALPNERGVVATCSYEARKFGVRSAMSIKEAYRRCPDGIYMYPNGHKYTEASRQIHKIWSDYTDLCECISLDEGFLDVTGSAHLFGGATAIGHEIKRRVKDEIGLTCSVGIGYSMMSAKLASEEKKPDGFFEILTPEDLRALIIDRSVRTIYGVGVKTAGELQRLGIITVRDIYERREAVVKLLGNHGKHIVDLADGIDTRRVTPYTEPKSIGNEHTFQEDIRDFDYLRDVLLLVAQKLSFDIRLRGLYCRTVTLKVTYSDMKQITRAKSSEPTDKASVIFETAAALLNKIEKRPVRLVGISLSGLSDTPCLQMTLFDSGEDGNHDKLTYAMMKLQVKYGRRIVKTASELRAEKRVWGED